MDFCVATEKPHCGLKWCCDTILGVQTQIGSLMLRPSFWCRDMVHREVGGDKELVSRPGLGLARRPYVATWNQCRDLGGPMPVATRPWCCDWVVMPSARQCSCLCASHAATAC